MQYKIGDKVHSKVHDIDGEIVDIDASLGCKLKIGPYSYCYVDEALLELRSETKSSSACEHKWVEVGFMQTKFVCYHCDVEKM